MQKMMKKKILNLPQLQHNEHSITDKRVEYNPQVVQAGNTAAEHCWMFDGSNAIEFLRC